LILLQVLETSIIVAMLSQITTIIAVLGALFKGNPTTSTDVAMAKAVENQSSMVIELPEVKK
jgi:hypothetical protein